MSKDKDVVIVSYSRTPFDKFGGVMRSVSSIELSRIVLENVVDKINLPKEEVDEIILGN